MQVYFHAISTARNHVYISTPYFLPNESILTALKTVALSGVDVKIMIPERSDSHMVYWASLSYVSELIETGINVYFYQAGFNHGKLLMVDGSFVSIGTANMDIRSFDQNFEINALIYDTSVADRMESYFLDDLKYCRKWKQEDWNNRPAWYQFREAFARLFSPLF
jgi:cardiolipin synthase